ncbi:MAG: hypothetical protein F4X64_13940 [Chloroflexi bacterium]|nr:hypothetical protein [Chloroflexota bacterium]
MADESGANLPDPSSEEIRQVLEALLPDDAEARQALALLATRYPDLRRDLMNRAVLGIRMASVVQSAY